MRRATSAPRQLLSYLKSCLVAYDAHLIQRRFKDAICEKSHFAALSFRRATQRSTASGVQWSNTINKETVIERASTSLPRSYLFSQLSVIRMHNAVPLKFYSFVHLCTVQLLAARRRRRAIKERLHARDIYLCFIKIEISHQLVSSTICHHPHTTLIRP